MDLNIVSLRGAVGDEAISFKVRIPNKKVFSRYGTKDKFIAKVLEYCKGKNGYNDIVAFCEPILEDFNEEKILDDSDTAQIGEVYLFKSGRYYKIGKTNDTVRRGSELRIQLPEKCTLIH